MEPSSEEQPVLEEQLTEAGSSSAVVDPVLEEAPIKSQLMVAKPIIVILPVIVLILIRLVKLDSKLVAEFIVIQQTSFSQAR